MPYTGRPRGSSGPIVLIPLGLGFIGVAVYFSAAEPLAGGVAIPFGIIGVVALVGGVVWILVRARQRRAAAEQMPTWTQPMPQPNTLSSGPWSAAPDTPPAVSGPVVMSSGSIDPALLQQLQQVGMAIADQLDDQPFGFTTTSVTVSPPVVIDVRAQQPMEAGAMLAGRATIDAVRDLNVTYAEQKLYELDLEVQPDGRPTYALTHRVLVPEASVGRTSRRSTSLPIRVSEHEPSQLVVDWAAP